MSPEGKRPYRSEALFRDELGRKKCLACLKFLPEASFDAATDKADGLRRECGACRRNGHLRRKYQLTPERVMDILAEQDDRCAICAGELPANFHVDHDHACCPGGESCGACVRGFLCPPCNVGLGCFADSPESLAAAIKYLKKKRRPL